MSRSRNAEEPLLADRSIVESFKAKLVYQLKQKGWKNIDLAQKMHVSGTAVGKWVRNGIIGKANLIALSQVFGKPVTYFMNPDIPIEDDDSSLVVSVLGAKQDIKAVQIRDYGLAHGLEQGSGGTLGPILSIMVRRTWLEAHLNVDPNQCNLFLYTIQSDTMTPTLNRGDVLIVDTDGCIAKKSGLYLVRIRGVEDVRRLQVSPDGMIAVSCDNTVYDDFSVTKDWADMSNFEILGSVTLPLALHNL